MTLNPPIVVHPIEEWSFFPDLGEAAAAIGEPFSYQICVERPPETPGEDELDGWLAELLRDYVNSTDGECESLIRTYPTVQKAIRQLSAALGYAATRYMLMYPTGRILAYVPEMEAE